MKVAVLLSGGVDSSVALHLIKQEGEHEITAFYLKIWLEDELSFLGQCPWEEDLQHVRAVCEQAEVSLEIVPLQTEYQDRVVSHAVSELKAGRTPSPDILCNQFIKFGLFFEKIDPGFERVVSGHYAQVEHRGSVHLLKRCPDAVKDQTYFLSRLSQGQLARIDFPIGHLTKSQVRELAMKFALPNASRPDSQGICFLGKIKYPDFVRYHLGEKPGAIVDQDTGRVLGEHRGVWFHTIGQREGLRLGGGPWYVVGKDLVTNQVWVAHGTRREQHTRSRLTIRDVHWIAGPPYKTRLQTKLRHGPHLEACTYESLVEDRAALELDHPDQGIAPGQYAVLYDGEMCLGGGVIE